LSYGALFWAWISVYVGGLVLASVLYSLPFTVQPLTAAFSVDQLLDASAVLGAGSCGLSGE
jgi:ABC-type molybdate transport system permease subunit